MFGVECSDDLHFAVSANQLDGGLKEQLGTELSANALSRKLNINASQLWEEHKVRYEKSHGHESRTIRLTLCDD